jgi:hypothetical protein
LIATLLALTLVAVTVCELVLPTTVATETVLGVTVSIADDDWGGAAAAGVVEAVTPPEQPVVHTEPAKRARRNTRATPRFECEEFNVVFPFLISSFVYSAAWFDSLRERPGVDRNQGARMLVSEAESDNLYGGQFWGIEGTVPVLCC